MVHGFNGVENEVGEGLLQLTFIAVHPVGCSLEILLQLDRFLSHRMPGQSQGVIENFGEPDRGQSGFRGPGKFQHLADDGFDALEFPLGEGLQFCVGRRNGRKFNERFNGHQGIFDFMRHAG